MAMNYGVGRRCCLDPELHRLAAVVLIGSLAWQLPYALGAALKRGKNNRMALDYFLLLSFAGEGRGQDAL